MIVVLDVLAAIAMIVSGLLLSPVKFFIIDLCSSLVICSSKSSLNLLPYPPRRRNSSLPEVWFISWYWSIVARASLIVSDMMLPLLDHLTMHQMVFSLKLLLSNPIEKSSPFPSISIFDEIVTIGRIANRSCIYINAIFYFIHFLALIMRQRSGSSVKAVNPNMDKCLSGHDASFFGIKSI